MFIIQVLIDAIMRYCLFTYRTGNSNPFLHAFILILNITNNNNNILTLLNKPIKTPTTLQTNNMVPYVLQIQLILPWLDS